MSALIVLVFGARAWSSDGDVGLLSASAPLPAGAAVTANATRQWPDRPGNTAPTVDEGSAYAEASVLFSAQTSLLISLGGYELQLASPSEAAPGEPLQRSYGYGEFEALPRYFSPQGWCLGADIDLICNHPTGSFSWNHADGSVVLFLHPNDKAVSSWLYELVYTSQPLYHLPELLPGLAYCLATPTLKACIGLPFSSIDWTPDRHWEISGQVANASTVAITHFNGIWQQALSWTWNPHLLRYPVATRGDFLIYEEISCDAVLQVTGEWGNAGFSFGRVLSRTLFDETRRTAVHWGPAWESGFQSEIDF